MVVSNSLSDWDWTCTHLALVDGDGPGQFERQLLSTEMGPTTRLEHPALLLQHLSNATQEPHTWKSWARRGEERSVWEAYHH